MRVRPGVERVVVGKVALRREGYCADRLSRFQRILDSSHPFGSELFYTEYNAAAVGGGQDRHCVDRAVQGVEGEDLALPHSRHLRAVWGRSSAGPGLGAWDPAAEAKARWRAGRLP